MTSSFQNQLLRGEAFRLFHLYHQHDKSQSLSSNEQRRRGQCNMLRDIDAAP
jgi:hypothetical protein